MKLSALALAAVMVGTFATLSAAHDGRGGLILEPQQSVGGIALGGTGITRCGMAEGFGVNPACLPYMRSPGIGFAHSTLIEGVTSSVSSGWIAVPLGKTIEFIGGNRVGSRFGIGLSLNHRSLDLAQGSSWASETVSVGFGYGASSYASAGILVKYMFSSSDVTGTQVTALGFDLGGRIELTSRLNLGVAVRNVGSKLSWDDGEDETPPVVVCFGGTLATPFGTFTDLAVTLAGSDDSRIGLGLDVPLAASGFHIRGGYRYCSGDESRTVTSAGIAFEHLRYRIAYAARIDDETAFGITHHFSLGTNFR
jgi:hypothetical protein